MIRRLKGAPPAPIAKTAEPAPGADKVAAQEGTRGAQAPPAVDAAAVDTAPATRVTGEAQVSSSAAHKRPGAKAVIDLRIPGARVADYGSSSS